MFTQNMIKVYNNINCCFLLHSEGHDVMVGLVKICAPYEVLLLLLIVLFFLQ